ncbi:nickel/cobalt transporter [Pantoea sp. At-9b]|uniref:nickel/cobalt transporter n=1 Tax=Pantoea sp. (strain At-9b) TaxID=592316 RepID=UPI0001B40A17|nr:nickel/cobalt transporter [Pantoea sp. At-9b]ADU70240.1 high-affinity nickel-transporter [Pantoea sp. At-9b]
MSLISLPAGSRRLWPLWLLALILLLAAGMLWQYWPQILLQSVLWQKVLNREMTQLLQQVAQQPQQAGVTLMLFSLAYGVLHALGPGHGKVVISTFLATHPARLKTSMKLTLLAALLQGGVAIGLVTVMLVVLQTSSRTMHLGSYWLEKGSYLLVMALGVWVGWRAVRALRAALKPVAKMQIHAIRPHHQHDEHCGCGHAHLPSAAQMEQAVSGKTQALVVFSMGLRPCSGAIMMLLFAKVIDVYVWGVASAIAMAMGTAVTVSAMGLLVQRSRKLAEKLGSASPTTQGAQVLMPLLAIVGSVVLVVVGALLWQSAQPMMSSGLRPF